MPLLILGTNNDDEYAQLVALGYSGSLNDMQFKYLSSLGYTGSLADKIFSHLTQPVVSLSVSASSIAEDASPGDSIGTLSASGGVGPYTYAIDTDTDAKFAIGGTGSDELVIRTGASLDYETKTSHSVTIQITDTGDSNATYLKTLTITVIDVPAPVATGALIDKTLDANIAMTALNVALDFTGTGITYALAPSSAALPTGLSLSSAGLITGTPTTPASAVTIVICGTNSEGYADSAFQITVQGDITAPDVTINSVANDEVNYTTNEAGTAYWLVNASATALGGSTIEAGGGSASGSFTVASSGTTSQTIDLSALSDGTYYMHLTIKDAAGNYSTDAPQSFDYTSAATAPSAFTSGQWSIADDGTGGDATITITALPSDGGSAITDLEAKVGAGSWTSLGGTTTGTYGLTDAFTDGVSTNVLIRAVNAVGNGADSDTKSVTTTAPAAGLVVEQSLVVANSGSITIGSNANRTVIAEIHGVCSSSKANSAAETPTMSVLTLGGNAMTVIGYQYQPSDRSWTAMAYIDNPSSGANTLSFTPSPDPQNQLVVTLTEYSGADQTNHPAIIGQGQSATGTVASIAAGGTTVADGSILHTSVTMGRRSGLPTAAATVDAGSTLTASATTGGANFTSCDYSGATKPVATAGADTTTHTWTGAVRIAWMAIEVRAA